MKIAYFDCFAGISGDMVLGALVDAGADFEMLQKELEKLALREAGGSQEFELTLDRVTKRGILAADVTVSLHHHHTKHSHSHGRGFGEIKSIIEASGLSERVKRDSVKIFRRLGEAEAKIHGKSIEEVHFHEVGAVDAIVDIVGACVCLQLLGIDKVYCSPIPTFSGTVEIEHGTFPLPAPATVEILKGAPWREAGIEGEIVTPTGAAIVATLAEGFGPMPAMSVESVGYGAGKKDFGIPNVLRVITGEATASFDTALSTQDLRPSAEVAVIETNIDDLSPQVYEVVMERLFEAGALDVYLTPIQMKKSRPATLLSVICEPAKVRDMSAIIFAETTSIGIRIDRRTRICLDREIVSVETEYGPIGVKVARHEETVLNIQPEYEDCKAAAIKHGAPFKRVRDAAVKAFYSRR